MDTVRLDAVRSNGQVVPVRLEIRDRNEASLTMWAADGDPQTFSGVDLLECLLDARQVLEADGLLLCCQGARPNVFPSGLLRQWDNGRRAYVLTDVRRSEGFEVVDVFAPADPSQVATVEEQRVFVFRFHGLPDPGPRGSRAGESA